MGKNVLEKGKGISAGYAAFVVASVFVFVLGGSLFFGGAIETMFMLAWLFTVPLIMKVGYTYKEVQNFGWKVVMESLEANFIILVVGTLIASFIASGTVPYIIVLGLKVISPQIFLLSALLICTMTSLATGTSWGTIGTAGVAMMGIGTALGVPMGMTAGAVISGAAFGDKMSPLSDTTNLAAAISGAPLMTHIKHMTVTTLPAYILSAIIFTFMGFFTIDTASFDPAIATDTINGLNDIFKLGILELIPIVLVITMLIKKVPPISAMLGGTFMAMFMAMIRQGYNLNKLLGFLYDGFSIETGTVYIDKLLNRGGIMSMISSFLIVFVAAAITGMLSESGVLTALVSSLAKKCSGSRMRTVGTTLSIGYLTNMIGSSMLLAIIVPGTLMKPLYEENDLAPENLSRTLEDSGTLGAWLIPWNANALFGAQTLMGIGATPYIFIPYCLLSIISPIFSMISAITGIGMKPLKKEEVDTVELSKS
jgi:Na+:H+ antiporter, NhaC family